MWVTRWRWSMASDRYTAQDALELIDVDYEPLDVVTRHGGGHQGGHAAGP